MNKVFSILMLLALGASALAQGSQPPAGKSRKPQKQATASARKAPARKAKPEPAPTPVDPEADSKAFDEAVAAPTAAEKAGLLRAFIDRFPESDQRADAFTYLITTRAAAAGDFLQAGDPAGAIASFKLAVEEAPLPVPDRVFNDVILKIPGTLFYNNQRGAAIELAQLIEKKVAANPKHLLAVAAYYLSIENGAEAKRVAEAAIAVDPASAAGYQAVGLANRLNFDLEEAANAYAKAVELDPASVPAKRSLAEMNRALNKPDAAVAIYREILAANESDAVARQGLILSLFDAGQQKEAEAELSKVLASESRNFALLTSVGYWYAAMGQGDKAVEHAQKAVEMEPRYIWGHIALARGLMKQNKPVDAERVLLRARQYGNFPTLDYELASARFQAGLYREAVEELQKNFSVKDGLVGTKLGGRIHKAEKSFQDLIAHERKASLLQPLPADRPETSEKLKLLLELSRKLESSAEETELAALADEFVNGTDKMKLHRQLYVANLFLQKNVALPKAAELVKASVANVDAGLDVSAPGAAVMAGELYESRSIAFARNEVVVIPEVPRQMLSAILRGRIEELAGWTLYQQKNYPEAVVRLRRSVSVLPDKSAWWRSSMWRLGTALEADGKEKEALDSYIKSYVTDRPSIWKYGLIEALYRKVNGSTDGLENKIGANPTTASLPVPKSDQQPPAVAPAATPEAGFAPPAETPRTATETLSKFPRHVPVDISAAKPDQQKPAVAEKPGISAESVKDTEPKNADSKTDPAEKVSPTESETVVVKDQSKTSDAIPESQVLPAVAEKPTVGKETEMPPESSKAAAVQQVATSEPPPATTAKDAPERSENEAASVKQPNVTNPAPENNPAAPQTPSKDQANDNPALKEVTPEKTEPVTTSTAPAGGDPKKDEKEPSGQLPEPNTVKREPEKTDPGKDIIEAASATSALNIVPPQEEKDSKAADRVPETVSKADAPISGVPSEAEPKTEPPRGGDPEKSEPVNPLRDPLANPNPEPARPDKPAKKPLIIINDPFKAEDKSSRTKTLFEPVIIKVPGGAPAGRRKDPPAGGDRAKADTQALENPSGGTRRRVIEGKEIVSDQQCSIAVSQESIMLLSGGGSLGLRVSVNGEGSIKDITASSGSPSDIAVRPEPLIDGITGRRFYVIKSISERTGIFQVNFESPCGKREIAVHVR